jgi:hypothetical protein
LKLIGVEYCENGAQVIMRRRAIPERAEPAQCNLHEQVSSLLAR